MEKKAPHFSDWSFLSVKYRVPTVDLEGYEVSAERLYQVIRESPGSRRLKRRLLSYLERSVIQGRPNVKCVWLGVAMANFAESLVGEDEALIAIGDNISDLDKLPYVIADGKPVQ